MLKTELPNLGMKEALAGAFGEGVRTYWVELREAGTDWRRDVTNEEQDVEFREAGADWRKRDLELREAGGTAPIGAGFGPPRCETSRSNAKPSRAKCWIRHSEHAHYCAGADFRASAAVVYLK
ncbi:hypothetical protein DACRYDRAFT_15295 [Dacryopinax primogenitus]|uniref:Uncharacterized protein n=1 Tax=Dacryopinax primogenitus (strain DJM 731) TaxID=1858805 RepID=M5GDR1_DACPD|nr:uncharacterized protein DACRYDRAFT_15295 [Dacryopinax primogenitus]EJU02628.1 hypothetical protein DACRYDRAFT_15295 [Dacryopinax primogenitus]